MIKFTGQQFICDCGNNHPHKFNKYSSFTIEIGARMRKKKVKVEGIICQKCKEVLSDEDLSKQIMESSKKKTPQIIFSQANEQEAQKV